LAFGAGCASAGVATTMAAVNNPAANEAVSARPNGRADAIR
jgi:hypothetical protein